MITNVPLPGNYYGWNTRDRILLVISIAPMLNLNLFPIEQRPNMNDFIIRMIQRMAVFAVIPSLNPKETHTESSKGCLFDFTIELKNVVNVVKTPFICHDCRTSIKRSQDMDFFHEIDDWIHEAPKLSDIKNP